jgi:hypothetical protein
MEVPYGYFAGVQGLDSGELDVFVGPDKTAPDVYLITTMKWPDYTEQDETKVMAQFASASAARHCFNHHYDNPRAFGWMVRMPVAVFQEKIRLARENGERL